MAGTTYEWLKEKKRKEKKRKERRKKKSGDTGSQIECTTQYVQC